MNICAECEYVCSKPKLVSAAWRCHDPAVRMGRNPLTGHRIDVGDLEHPLCSVRNSLGKCTGFERKEETCEHKRCYSEQTMKAVAVQRDRYENALKDIATANPALASVVACQFVASGALKDKP